MDDRHPANPANPADSGPASASPESSLGRLETALRDLYAVHGRITTDPGQATITLREVIELIEPTLFDLRDQLLDNSATSASTDG